MRAMVIAWSLITMIIGLAYRWIDEYRWILSTIPVGLWVILGLALISVNVNRIVKDNESYAPAVYIMIMILAAATFLKTTSLSDALFKDMRFQNNVATYKSIVASVDNNMKQRGSISGVEYEIDYGPPIRVAFPWPGSIIDNWCGIVYDPTGKVLNINSFEFEIETQGDKPIREIFGGDLISCRGVEGNYYYCCFT